VLQEWPAPSTLPGALITLLGLALVVRALPTASNSGTPAKIPRAAA
jgi:hypothetical protein